MVVSDWASVIVAAGLLFVTLAYTYFTYIQITPHLRVSLEYRKTDQLYFYIHNIGKGAAYDVEAQWIAHIPNSDLRKWKADLLLPDDRHKFTVPLGALDSRLTEVAEISRVLGGKNGMIEYHASCKTLSGSTKCFHQTISIRNALNRLDQAGELPELSPVDKLSESIEGLGPRS